MAYCLSAGEEPCLAEHPDAIADPDDRSALVGLRAHPGQQGGIVDVMDRRDDDIVGAVGKARIELLDGRLGL